jgi:outer membrane protein assembly factor BamD (BamD/ComL family)
MREGFPLPSEVDDARFNFEVSESNLNAARHGYEHSKSVYRVWDTISLKLNEALYRRAEKKFAQLQERKEAGEFLDSYVLRKKYEGLKTNVEQAVKELEEFEANELKVESDNTAAPKES